MTFKIIVNDKEVRIAKKNYSIKYPEGAKRGAYRFNLYLGNRLSESAPYGATGYLKRTLVKPHKIGRNRWSINAPFYLEFLTKGTKAHFIPRIRKTEIWARRHGMTFSQMKYNISEFGTKPNDFVNTVYRRARKDFLRTVMEEIKR